MRMFFGLILGCAITVGGAYIADHISSDAAATPMVNWDVVAKNVDSVMTIARDGWKRIAEIGRASCRERV